MNSEELCKNLWYENEAGIRKICSIKLRSCPQEIDDTVSEVFLILCRKISENNIPQNPKAFLYAVLNNVINQKYRDIYKTKEKEKPISDNEYELFLAYDIIEEKIEEIYNSEIKQKLKILLNEDEYDLITKIHFDKMKMKEIAVLYHSTEAAVKQKHYRICRKLQKIIKEPKNLI